MLPASHPLFFTSQSLKGDTIVLGERQDGHTIIEDHTTPGGSCFKSHFCTRVCELR